MAEQCRAKGKTPPQDLRRTLEAILWRHQNGAKWRAVPSKLGPRWMAAQTFIRWARLGHWLPQELQARREVLRRRQARLQEFRRCRRDLDQAKEALEGQVRQLEAQVDRRTEIARLSLNIDEFCRLVQDGLEQATWEQKRQLIEWRVVRVIVTDGEVEIHYAIPTSPAREATRFCHLHSDYRGGKRLAERMAARCNPL